MTDQHPITPPPELVRQWRSEPEYATPGRVTLHTISEQRLFQLLTRSAQWGADQELEACSEWLDREGWPGFSNRLRAVRRPKPPSLKEQALSLIDDCNDPHASACDYLDDNALSIIRRALEALPDD